MGISNYHEDTSNTLYIPLIPFCKCGNVSDLLLTEDTHYLPTERKLATTWLAGLFACISSTCESNYAPDLTGATSTADVRFLMLMKLQITYICNDFVLDFTEFGLGDWVFQIPTVKIGNNTHPLSILVRVDEPPRIKGSI